MAAHPPDRAPRVAISVLNWNSADATLACVRSVLAAKVERFETDIVVVDNGSAADDVVALRAGLRGLPVRLVELPENLGFAAGHNLVMQQALDTSAADHVWLLNNDALVDADTLQRLVDFMRDHPTCGAVSPVIYALHDAELMDFCGARHDWSRLDSHRPGRIEDARRLEAESPAEMWLHGTAILLRVAALRAVGLLDEAYFAYFEDDDLGTRLSRAGWTNRVCFDARMSHARRKTSGTERPAYFFYLMARNALLFWHRHATPAHRAGLRRRLVCRSLIAAANLQAKGFDDKANACLVGVAHGLSRRTGRPDFSRRAPAWLSLAARWAPYRLLDRLARHRDE